MPLNVAAQVISDGVMDYRPKLGDFKQVVKTRQTHKTLSSFFRSELHMALLECVAKDAPAEAADPEPVFALLEQPRLVHALHRV